MVETHNPVSSMQNPTTVSVVLGSGGARGLAHIGVIDWLTQNGYTIRSIAGSSMGALIGGIHAAGKLGVYTEWVSALERIDVVRLLDPSFDGTGLFKGERIIAFLRDLIGECRIEDLPLSFTAVATDMLTGKEVWLREGRLFDAIRASMSTPLVFTPFEHEGRRLLDGALVNPIPIAPTLNDRTDLTIAVDLNGPAEQLPVPAPVVARQGGNHFRERIRMFIDGMASGRDSRADPPGAMEILFASLEAMGATIARLKLAAYAPDVIVHIPRNACGYHEFWRAQEMIAFGRSRTQRAFAERMP